MENTDDLCRVCGISLCKTGHRMDQYIAHTSLEQMLSYCTKTDISSIDGAPYALCSKCRADLLIAYELIVLYHETAQRWCMLNEEKKLSSPGGNINEQIEQSNCLYADTIDTIYLEENAESPFEMYISTSSPSAHSNLDETDYEDATELVQEDLNSRDSDKKSAVHSSKLGLRFTCGENSTSTVQSQAYSQKCGLDNFVTNRRDRRPKCCGCYAEFDTRELLKAHSNSAHKPDGDGPGETIAVDRKEFACDICFRRYKTRRILLEHKQRPYRTERYQCERCGKSFRVKCRLAEHERVHKNEHPYVCEFCSKTFAMRDSYRQHLLLHTVASDRFKCEVCGKGCRTKGNLKNHYITHMVTDRPFQCPSCTSQFTRKSCLKSHMRLHTGDKPYKCDLCEACYTFPTDLRRHMMAHKGIKPFVCDVCGRGYSRNDYLAKHIASSHLKEDASKVKLEPALGKRTSNNTK